MPTRPGWLAALAGRAAPLAQATEAFLSSLQGAPAGGLPRGGEGLLLLADLVERHCAQDDPTDEDERRFVEGAGASLGLLLLDHVGEGAWEARDGVGRLRLGPRGFVDPFAIIEAVLDAEEPRAALAAAVRRAEAEARDEGRVSRVVAAFEGALGRARPDLAVRERFERYVRLSDGTEVDLHRVIDATAAPGADLAGSVDKLVSMLPGGEGSGRVPAEEARARLLPRIVSDAFLAELAARAGAPSALWSRPLGGGAHVCLVLAHGDRSRYVRADEPADWSLAPEQARALAIANLAARSAQARFARVETDDGPLVVAASGDGLDAARLLLPGLRGLLFAELGTAPLVAIPHRDALLAAPREPAGAAVALAARAARDAAVAPQAITRALFELGPDGPRARAAG